MKVLLTGVAGFIGFHAAKLLMDCGFDVVGIDNLNDNAGDRQLKLDRLAQLGVLSGAGRTGDGETQFNFELVDICDKDSLGKIFEANRFDAVIHLAAQAGVHYSLQNPDAYIQSNLVGFGNILDSCREFEVGHLVYASSSSVYGNSTTVPFLEDQVDYRPTSLYAATKQSNEHMAYAYSHVYGIRTTGLRFFTVYGPWGRMDMAYTLFAESMLTGQTIKVFNYGNQYRDFTYIDDVAMIFPEIINKENWNDKNDVLANIYNIGNSSPVQLMDFIKTLEKILGVEAEKELVAGVKVDVERTYADVRRAAEAFGFSPSCDLETGLQVFVDWYREYRQQAEPKSVQAQLG